MLYEDMLSFKDWGEAGLHSVSFARRVVCAVMFGAVSCRGAPCVVACPWSLRQGLRQDVMRQARFGTLDDWRAVHSVNLGGSSRRWRQSFSYI